MYLDSESQQVSALRMVDITKTYPGVRALDNVKLEIGIGEVHALVGENGAGKSTLMRVLAGAHSMDSGEIYLNGRAVKITSPQQAIELGIGIIYQEFNLVPYLSVAENIFLGHEPKGIIPGVVSFSDMYTESKAILDNLGVKLNVRTPVENLSIARQQMVEIAKATSRKASIIAMDEPSATLTDHELRNLFKLILSLKERGVSIIYISHRLEEILEIADRVTIFRDGRYVDTKLISETNREDIIRMMVGRELAEIIPKQPVDIGNPALEVRNLTRKGIIEDITFSVNKGEILGIAGLVGAGRTEVARAIFGADPIDSGEIWRDGEKVEIKSPAEAISHGIGLVPEDRKSLGLILELTVRENISLANLNSLSHFGVIDRTGEKRVAESYVQDIRIKTPNINQEVQNLSGGNQQKVILARWLFTHSKILIFDEPTRGIDVGAKTEIYQLMNRLAAEGAAIIMISSELSEVLGMSDRILVMYEGKIAGTLGRNEATQERIMSLATGGK